MIKRENRLKKNKHFNYIYKHGCAVRGNKLNLIYIKTKFKTFKVGFSVSSKVGKAVVRNKVKRRLKECFSQIVNVCDRRYNYIFVAKEGISEFTFLQLKQIMIDLVKSAGLYQNDN